MNNENEIFRDEGENQMERWIMRENQMERIRDEEEREN